MTRRKPHGVCALRWCCTGTGSQRSKSVWPSRIARGSVGICWGRNLIVPVQHCQTLLFQLEAVNLSIDCAVSMGNCAASHASKDLFSSQFAPLVDVNVLPTGSSLCRVCSWMDSHSAATWWWRSCGSWWEWPWPVARPSSHQQCSYYVLLSAIIFVIICYYIISYYRNYTLRV